MKTPTTTRNWLRKRKRSRVRRAFSHRVRRAALVGIPMLLLLAFGGRMSAASFFPSEPAPQKTSATKDYALIIGTVWGADNRPAAGVPIKIRRATDKKSKWELVSDNRGEFAQRVPPGTHEYIIQADIKMPKGQPKPEITVKIDNNERK